MDAPRIDVTSPDAHTYLNGLAATFQRVVEATSGLNSRSSSRSPLKDWPLLAQFLKLICLTGSGNGVFRKIREVVVARKGQAYWDHPNQKYGRDALDWLDANFDTSVAAMLDDEHPDAHMQAQISLAERVPVMCAMLFEKELLTAGDLKELAAFFNEQRVRRFSSARSASNPFTRMFTKLTMLAATGQLNREWTPALKQDVAAVCGAEHPVLACETMLPGNVDKPVTLLSLLLAPACPHLPDPVSPATLLDMLRFFDSLSPGLFTMLHCGVDVLDLTRDKARRDPAFQPVLDWVAKADQLAFGEGLTRGPYDAAKAARSNFDKPFGQRRHRLLNPVLDDTLKAQFLDVKLFTRTMHLTHMGKCKTCKKTAKELCLERDSSQTGESSLDKMHVAYKVQLKTCSGCHAVYYCSQACQRRDWPSHKNACAGLRAKWGKKKKKKKKKKEKKKEEKEEKEEEAVPK